ncbi:MAG: FkbM family methyltransferase [Actinomycetota bacterium]
MEKIPISLKAVLSPVEVFYKIADGGINLLRKLKVYNFIYSISLSFIDIFNRRRYKRFYSKFIKSGDLVFDIGANMGSMTEVFLSLGARVIAVEPQDKCVGKLKGKYGDNQKVVLLQKAVSDSIGKDTLMISDSHTVSSMSKNWTDNLKSGDIFFGKTSVFEWQKSREVETVTLDKLIKEYGKPVFCKVDVEGYEYKVLKGLTEPLDAVSFEFTPTKEFIRVAVNIVKHLSTMGSFEFNYSLGESVKLVLADWVGREEFEKILEQLPEKVSICGDIYARQA